MLSLNRDKVDIGRYLSLNLTYIKIEGKRMRRREEGSLKNFGEIH